MPVASQAAPAGTLATAWPALRWRAVYLGCGAIVAALSSFAPHPATISPLFVALCLMLLLPWFFATFLLWLAKERPADPLRQIGSHSPQALLSMLDRSLLFLTIPLFWSYFAPVKAMIPAVSGFWADPYLAATDRFIFLGADPSALTHRLFGTLATRVVDVIYASWLPVILILAFLIAVRGDERSRARFYAGWGLIWLLLGIGGAFALGSAGPIFGTRLGFGFEGLSERLHEINQAKPLIAIMASDTLWANYQSGHTEIGNGISAAPSLHCAIAFFMALLARGTKLFPLAAIYAAIIWIGSVHLGWHYFVDGLLSLAGVLLLWPIICRLAGERGQVALESVLLARLHHREG